MALRIALISALKRSSTGVLRANQMLAGRSIFEWQVDFALRLGADRIICLCEAPPDQAIAEQRLIEARGGAFHTVRTQVQFANLVKPDDDVFMQMDGLVLGEGAIDALISSDAFAQSSIISLDANHSFSVSHQSDFERIDRERHWAGIALLPGDCAASLKDMPGDGDTISLLLRLALQSRVPCEPAPLGLLEDDQWLLALDSEGLERRSNALLQASLIQPSWTGPVAALAATTVRKTATRWLGGGAEVCAGVSIGMMGIAAGLAGFGFGVAGLSVAAVSALVATFAVSAGQLRSGISSRGLPPRWLRFLAPVLGVLAIATIGLANSEAANWPVQFAIACLALGLAHLAGREGADREGAARERAGREGRPASSAFWRDTPSHLVLFAIAASLGLLQEALLLFSLGALAQLMLRPDKASTTF